MQVVRCGRFVFSFVVCGFVELSALFDKIHGERTEQRDISLVFFSSLHRIHTLLDSVWTYFLVCSLHSSPLLNFQVMVDFFCILSCWTAIPLSLSCQCRQSVIHNGVLEPCSLN